MRTSSLSCLIALLLIAPLAHAQQRQRDNIVLHFAFNRFDIDPGPTDTAEWHALLNHPAFPVYKIDSIIITGYTDSIGTIAYNHTLSAHRAGAVAQYFKHRLLPDAMAIPMQLIAGGKAPTPEASDSANRRAEIVIWYHRDTPPDAAAAQPANAAAAPSPAAAPTPAAPPNPAAAQPANPAAAQAPDTPTTVITLHHINFVVDTPIPTPATQTVLPGYVKLLQQYKDRRLEIDGYVNSFTPLHGEEDPLFILSVNRAKFIYDYLVAAGFDSTKLSYKGMGNASPVNPNPSTKKEMDANMRVEIKIF
jgi:outer membrane protein OmpA-like peptidoglycan-associated protein